MRKQFVPAKIQYTVPCQRFSLTCSSLLHGAGSFFSSPLKLLISFCCQIFLWSRIILTVMTAHSWLMTSPSCASNCIPLITPVFQELLQLNKLNLIIKYKTGCFSPSNLPNDSHHMDIHFVTLSQLKKHSCTIVSLEQKKSLCFLWFLAIKTV